MRWSAHLWLSASPSGIDNTERATLTAKLRMPCLPGLYSAQASRASSHRSRSLSVDVRRGHAVRNHSLTAPIGSAPTQTLTEVTELALSLSIDFCCRVRYIFSHRLLARGRGRLPGERRERRSGSIRQPARVVVVFGNPLESISENHRWDWNCVPMRAPYARECAAETFIAYWADLGAIHGEILKLRGDEPVLIRTFDAYNPF